MNRPAKVDEVVIAMANKSIAIRANPSDGGPVMLSVRDRASGVFGEAWLSQRAAARLYKLLGVALGLGLLIASGGACGDNLASSPDARMPDTRSCAPMRLDAGSGQMCTQRCEDLGCVRDEYEPSCTKGGTVCTCNGVTCEGTP